MGNSRTNNDLISLVVVSSAHCCCCCWCYAIVGVSGQQVGGQRIRSNTGKRYNIIIFDLIFLDPKLASAKRVVGLLLFHEKQSKANAMEQQYFNHNHNNARLDSAEKCLVCCVCACHHESQIVTRYTGGRELHL